MNQEIDILVEGRPVRKIAHDGKIFIIAKPGTQYEIRLKNNSTSRVMAACSVDGLSVLDGEPAKSDGAGYLINGYGSYSIKGWRTSNEEVHPFQFSKKSKSYAEKSENGTTLNCGIIGVVFHAEKIKTPKVEKEYIPYPVYPKKPWTWPFDDPYRPYQPYWDNDRYYCGDVTYTMTSSLNGSNNVQNSLNNSGILRTANVSSLSASTNFDLGTKFSKEVVEDQVTTAKFKIAYELGRIEIYYASLEVLKKMGVPTERAKEVAFPQAFSGFCKVPEE